MNRPQTSGPLDLDVLLRAVADEVTPRTDDETAARRVAGGVRHARRRRAVLVGTAAVLAVAAVGVGASAVLADDDDPRPVLPAPAPSPDPTTPPEPEPSPDPTHRAAFPSPVTRDSLLCQAPAPAATGPDLLATVSVDAAAVSVESLRLVDVTAHLTVVDDARAEVLDPVARAGYVILQDGVVVSSTVSYHQEPVDPVRLDEGQVLDVGSAVDSFALCDPEGVASHAPSLLPGEYELAAVVPWVVSSYALERDGAWGEPVTSPGPDEPLFEGWLVSESVPFVVEPSSEEPGGGDGE